MLIYNFKDYAGFQERFGMTIHGNGEISRKNKILLSYISQPTLFYEASRSGDYSLINIKSMSELKEIMLKRIQESGKNDDNLTYEVHLMSYTFYSSRYESDELKGICADADTRCIRYINHNSNDVVKKMKAGKFLQQLILETEFGQTLPQEVLIYLMEEFAMGWQSYASEFSLEYKLQVDDNFHKIYSSRNCDGDFGSCMTDRGHHYFYAEAVNASAASLQNRNGIIVARCIVYNKVYDEEGKIWRLAERQYSTNGDNIKKQMLVDALIREGEIDGYKTVGAGCSEATAFVDVHGNSLSSKKFHIECNLDSDDTLSYQDSFKWYDMETGIAYNYERSDADYDLATTDLNLYGDTDDDDENCYDSYHDRSAEEVITVFVEGHAETCDVDSLEDFVLLSNGEYHHEDDVTVCEHCGKKILNEDAFYSSITDKDYCCTECKQKEEQAYIKEYWYFSEYDNKHFEKENEVTHYNRWDENEFQYKLTTISVNTLDSMIEAGIFHVIDGNVYDMIDDETGLPIVTPILEEACI